MNARTHNRRILVIDDNPSIHEDFRKILAPQSNRELGDLEAELFGAPIVTEHRFEIASAHQGEKGIELVHAAKAAGSPFAVAFVDIRMPPGLDDIETTARLLQIDPDLQIVICSAYSDHTWSDIRTRLGATDRVLILKKPFDAIEVQQLAFSLAMKWSLLQEQHRVLFNRSPVPMFAFDHSLAIVSVNDAMVAISGYSRQELLSMNMGDLANRERIASSLNTSHVGVVTVTCKDGSHVELDMTTHAIEINGRACFLTVAADVTHTRRVEEQLRQAQKMEAIGQLAGGVAHDFNNLLAVIQLNVEWLASTFGGTNPVPEEITAIVGAAERGAQLTRQLLAFSRKQPSKTKPLSLNATLAEIHKMLGRLVGEDIELICDLARDLDTIEADEGQIAQVLMNLVINARDAMPRGGSIRIQTSNVVLDASEATLAGVPAGSYVELSVTDSGCGMSEATMARIFEPFFTTKEVGKGTGLGLATVFGIVKQSKGGIQVSSELGVGSTFRIYLPSSAEPSRASDSSRSAVTSTVNSERVLLVEDDEHMRAAISRILRGLGYSCMASANPVEALELLKDSSLRIDLLITDLVMPGMDGRTFAAHARLLQPTMKLIIMSGYTEHPAINAAVSVATNHFIHKPFTPKALSQAIRAALTSEISSVS